MSYAVFFMNTFIKKTHSITQQEEQHATSNTHADRGDHILITKATIEKHRGFHNYNFKYLMTTILVETCSEKLLKS
jgi:hypothetical protein